MISSRAAVASLSVLLLLAGCSRQPGDAADPTVNATSTPPSTVAPTTTGSPTSDVAGLWSCGADDPDHGWGLHCSPPELDEWRVRAREGPYRVTGDAAPNSPGDWQRIQGRATSFLEEPTVGRWTPEGAPDRCVAQGDAGPPAEPASALRDAAFVALLAGREDLAAAVRSELLWLAREPSLDFARRDVWCPDVLYDVNPGFEVANWLTKLLYAYDYLGPAVFPPAEVAELDRWFGDAATFLAIDLDASFERLFVDRDAEPQELDPRVLEDPCDELTYLGGPRSCGLHQAYNNRKAAIARFVALVGHHQRRDELVRTGRRFVEELLAYSVFPEGTMGEFERWEPDLPDLGWAYATQTVAAAITIADAAARDGDDGLYRYETSLGALGTEGGPKSLRSACVALLGYLDGTYDRYVGPPGAEVGDRRWRIDGVDEASGWYSVHDAVLTPIDRYLGDPALAAAYLRTGPDLPPYPPDPAGEGPHIPWTGDHGTFPGVLLMFGDLGAPYPGVSHP